MAAPSSVDEGEGADRFHAVSLSTPVAVAEEGGDESAHAPAPTAEAAPAPAAHSGETVAVAADGAVLPTNGGGDKAGCFNIEGLEKYLFWKTFEQVKAVAPLSFICIFTRVVAFGEPIEHIPAVAAGLIVVTIGLTLFIEGLCFGLMPVGEKVGKLMPRKLPLPATLFICFILGVAVTIAEPAIAALARLGSLVSRENAPYLSYMLHEWSFVTQLSIGAGVGLATVIGVMRMLMGWSLKAVIVACLAPILTITCLFSWVYTDLRPVVGLSWDSGAITTGPVTLPILLAIGLGVASTQESESELASLGVVTIASLVPIFTVQCEAIVLYNYIDADEIRNTTVIQKEQGILHQFPVEEIWLACRALIPLIVILLFLLKVVLKESFPVMTFKEVIHLFMIEHEGHVEPVPEASSPALPTHNAPPKKADESAEDGAKLEEDGSTTKSAERVEEEESMAERKNPDVVVGIVTKVEADPYLSQQGGHKDLPLLKNAVFWGLVCNVLGLILFNLGLVEGLVRLGSQAGDILPAAFQEDPDVANSPLYSYGVGIFIVLLFAFTLGFFATVAEPALYVLGITAAKLTNNRLTPSSLLYSVSLGVGIGMILGVCKIIYDLPIAVFILVTYALALSLTLIPCTKSDVTYIAWDSAGVTTGEVTVPFVLSSGVALGLAVQTSDGFGILTMASVMPISAVIIAYYAKKINIKCE